MSNRRNFIKATVLAAALSSIGMAAQAADTIKVGILHSLSGTMAISETALKETALMTIEEINKNGGVLGKKLEPVVVDPASNWPLFAEKARELLTKNNAQCRPSSPRSMPRARRGRCDAGLASRWAARDDERAVRTRSAGTRRPPRCIRR